MDKRLEQIESEIEEYTSRRERKHTVNPDSPGSAVVHAPIPVVGGSFYDPGDLPDTLPPISQKNYEFALDYAFNPRRMSQVAEEYGVTVQSVWKWLSDRRIRTYIASFRYDARMRHLAGWMEMEREATQATLRILRMRPNSNNIGVIGQMARHVLSYTSQMRGGPSIADGEGVNINVNTSSGGQSQKRERNVTASMSNQREDDPESLRRQIEEAKEEIEELEAWEDMVSNNGGE